MLLLAFSSCEKESAAPQETTLNGDKSLRVGACTTLSYADSVVYLKEQKGDYIVSPTKKLKGFFSAIPGGLQIDAATGAVNVTRSERGLRYQISYAAPGSTDTCITYMTISGLDYVSAVYTLSKKDTLAKPLYNGQKTLPWNAGGSDSEFDDDENGANTGSGVAGSQGIAVDKKDGSINLKRTLSNGTFGASPKNGTTRTVRLYYRISDASKKALNYIDIKFTYYAKYSDIPASTLARINAQNSANARVMAPSATGPMQYLERGLRPPEIVIVGG